MNEEHILTVKNIPHRCDGYQVQVRCSCGYAGQAAHISHECTDSAPVTASLDAVHEAALDCWEAGRGMPASPRQWY